MFDVALANWVGEPPGLCVHSETCGLALALEHTGDLYSCDHFVEPRYKLGNIRETPHARARRLAAAAAVRARQARDPAPATASSATCASPATAAAPRTASSRRPTASPASTTSAPATRTSSTTSTADALHVASSSDAAVARRRRSCASTRPRMLVAGATTHAPAAPAASGSTATVRTRRLQEALQLRAVAGSAPPRELGRTRGTRAATSSNLVVDALRAARSAVQEKRLAKRRPLLAQWAR